MNDRDLLRCQHILSAAREAVKLCEDKSLGDIRHDRLLNLGLVRLLEIVGEAANRISIETQENFANVPWRAIVGMRNRLIHGYDSIDFAILYRTINEDLPPLIEKLNQIIN